MSYENFFDPAYKNQAGRQIPAAGSSSSGFSSYSLDPAISYTGMSTPLFAADLAPDDPDYSQMSHNFLSSARPVGPQPQSQAMLESRSLDSTGYDAVEHARLDPTHFDSSRFSPQFVTPRYAVAPVQPPPYPPAAPSQEQSMISQSSLKGFDYGVPRSQPSSPTLAPAPSSMLMGPPTPRQASHPPPQNAPQQHAYQISRGSPRRSFSYDHTGNPSPIYDLYGSSVVSIAPSTSSHKLSHDVVSNNNVPASPSAPYDPAAMGLPMPPPRSAGDKNWQGLYSSSGIDMMGVLARVATRPNPEIQMGPVDMGCSFLVTDARKFDMPIVYASETFSKLTGYSNEEILGRNCRFLQSPDGIVSQGSKRKYTDGNAVHHLRQHVISGKETQASLINYHKSGKPFINLVTVIPITWDSDEIAFFVGFQVDLVDQPAAILEKMKNGTYVVNYTLSRGVPRIPSVPSVDTDVIHVEDDSHHHDMPRPSFALQKVIEPMEVDSAADILDQVARTGVKGFTTEAGKKHFNRLLLEHCDDFVHVVSLKGTFLYVSPSSSSLLQYEPQELIGKTLASVCHPSDIVAVLRELKESGAADHPTVNLLYRIRRKSSGYMWLEASGKLHIEQGKGRKCIILVGRPQRVYKVSWAELERAGGLGEKEYWSKLSFDGMYLYTTPSVQGVLGYSSEELMGFNIKGIDEGGELLKAIMSLNGSPPGQGKSIAHKLRGKNGSLVDVVTNFYPDHVIDEPTSPVLVSSSRDLPCSTIIVQTNLLSSELAKHSQQTTVLNRPRGSNASTGENSSGGSTGQSLSPVALPLPMISSGRNSDGDLSSGSGGSSSNTSFSAIPSTFKTLSSSASDNIFDELDTTRGTSWQFELHQLRLVNRKLREEKDALVALQRKRRKRAHGEISGSPKASLPGQPRSCANCGRTGSPEWRSGPTGPKTLCNACGLRWSKARSQSISASSTPSLSGNSRPGSGSASGSSGLISPPRTVNGPPVSRPMIKTNSSSQGYGFSPLVLPRYDSTSSASSFSPATPDVHGLSDPGGGDFGRPQLKTTESSLALAQMTLQQLTLPPPYAGPPPL